MAEWEKEDAEERAPVRAKSAWDDEEEDDDVKDSWDIDSEEEREKERVKVQAKRQKEEAEKERVRLEKEAKKAQEAKQKAEEEAERNETPAQRKARMEAASRESDLAATRDLFGMVDIKKSAPKPAAPTDTNLPLPTAATKRQDDLQPLLDTLIACLTPMSISHPKLYPTFIEQLAHPLFEPLEAAELRKISSSLNAMISEKQKREREQNAKGKGAKAVKKATVKVANPRGVDTTNYEAGNDYGDDYDFM